VGVAAERPQETFVANFEAIVATSFTHATPGRPNYKELAEKVETEAVVAPAVEKVKLLSNLNL